MNPIHASVRPSFVVNTAYLISQVVPSRSSHPRALERQWAKAYPRIGTRRFSWSTIGDVQAICFLPRIACTIKTGKMQYDQICRPPNSSPRRGSNNTDQNFSHSWTAWLWENVALILSHNSFFHPFQPNPIINNSQSSNVQPVVVQVGPYGGISQVSKSPLRIYIRR